MSKLKRAILFSFRTKVIVPVLIVMVLLMAVSMSLINRSVTRQIQADAAQQLQTAEAVFKNSQTIRANYLFLRYRNVAKEPRFKTVASLGDQNTFRRLLHDLVDESVADVIMISPGDDRQTTVTRDARVNLQQFESVCQPLVEQAVNGQVKVELVKNGDRLFDVVTLPILVGEGSIVGAVTFAVENSVVQEFHQLTHSEMILLSDGEIVASTLNLPELPPVLSTQTEHAGSPVQLRKGRGIEEVELHDEHYLSLAGSISEASDSHQLNYLLLSSYEKPLQILRSTQMLILRISAVGILLGTALIWFLIRRAMQPLQQLRDSVEAVSQGDLSKRIEVASLDECGELAVAFNQMTENLKQSRGQLEETVDSLKTTQAQLVQSEKLAGIGEFVSGVAHELNNPLTSVMGFSELLLQMNAEPKLQRHLDIIYKSAQRCQKIVQSLLSFARRHQPERKAVCVNGLIEAAMDILLYQLRTSNIEVRTKFDPSLPLAMVDPHQLQQVFLNIINNARQAIEAHQAGGWIKITTEASGPNVRITFQDNGPGIKPENLSKLFDPFFTTKEVGKGTGLGLSLCYGIIKEHGGTITPRSRPGEGAMFVIELPITHEATQQETGKKLPETDIINPREGLGKRVLVVDDEEPILQMLREILTRRGYEVDAAIDGKTGLNCIEHNRYDLVLCDWKMPGLNGQDVYEELRVKNSALAERVIFITGDVINDRVRKFLEENNRICLPKPFSLAEFRDAMKKVMSVTS